MGTVDGYLQLAQRPNTERSYAAAVRHFETQWRGLLPATPQLIAEYLATFGGTLSINTLQSRLAGLSHWHRDHGFQDPTKASLVQQVLKGIRAAHNAPEKQARPIEFDRLEHVSAWLADAVIWPSAPAEASAADVLRHTRDQAMLLIGFWRGFRADELSRLSFEHIVVRPGVDLTCFLPRSKTDRQSAGNSFQCPALSKLCPVTAFENWQALSGLRKGPVFRRIDRWGHVSAHAMAAASVVPWLRSLFARAGVEDPTSYSSHSLRRGFANWAKSSGWDIKELMEYVGWKDINSALKYLECSPDELSTRFERGLARPIANGRTRPRPPAAKSGAPGSGAVPGAGTNVVPLPRRPA